MNMQTVSVFYFKNKQKIEEKHEIQMDSIYFIKNYIKIIHYYWSFYAWSEGFCIVTIEYKLHLKHNNTNINNHHLHISNKY